jgi:hypothetical protein
VKKVSAGKYVTLIGRKKSREEVFNKKAPKLAIKAPWALNPGRLVEGRRTVSDLLKKRAQEDLQNLLELNSSCRPSCLGRLKVNSQVK